MPAVDLDAARRLDGLGHLDRTHRSEEPASPRRPGGDRDHRARQQLRLGLRCAAVLGLAQVTPAAHLLGLTLAALGCQDGAPLGEEEVPGEAARHLDDVPTAAHTGHVVAQYDLHASPPASAVATSGVAASSAATSSAAGTADVLSSAPDASVAASSFGAA